MTNREKNVKENPEAYNYGRQERLLANSHEVDWDSPITFTELNHRLVILHENTIYRRDSSDYFKVVGVQELVDYARVATNTVQRMKETAIKAGVGQYNSKTGRFEFIGKKKRGETNG